MAGSFSYMDSELVCICIITESQDIECIINLVSAFVFIVFHCYPYHFIGIRVPQRLSGGLSNLSVQPREGKKEEKKKKKEKTRVGPGPLFFKKKFQPAPTSNARSEFLLLPFLLPFPSTFTHQLSWLCS